MTKFNESQWFLQLRRRKCFNQTEFGELLGVSQSTVAEIEAGKRQLRLSEFLTIVRELDLKYDEYPINLKRHQIIDKLI
ncbi:MAG: transcriptional regulator with XRE-family HTH domain, partial [Salibacteraceae bacterium]